MYDNSAFALTIFPSLGTPVNKGGVEKSVRCMAEK